MLKHLVNVQMRTATFFDIRNEVTAEVALEVETTSRLLNGDEIAGTWQQESRVVRPGGREAIEAKLNDPPGARRVRADADFTNCIQGVDIHIGWVMRVLDSARIHSWEEPLDGEPGGTTTLVLVLVHTDKVTMRLDAGDG